ncbi:M14 family zinc carboxypeptidase [Nocardiopsis baichengensis]|uniref:M14 family zinc carboxypeptidase n=1 Tax=Nocardiopsis baichengensis TaxID=280240 RepID=UPI000344C62B|nr:M14 family zinc carboxypeptidase [Nocardiopsis baichengensis]
MASARLAFPAVLAAAALAGGALTALSAPAAAEPAAAPCSPHKDTGTASWTDHAELGDELQRLERRSKGALEVEVAGRSGQGREIWTARVGEGPRTVMVASEIHGNEKTGTEAVLRLLRSLSGPSKQARELREQVTVVAVPKMNPDGSELDRRGNDRSWSDVVDDFPQLEGAPPSWNHYTGELQGDDYAQRPGFDVNRDFNPDLDYVPDPADLPGDSASPGWFVQPESQAVRDAYVALAEEKGGVDAYIDLHHQGPCYQDENGEFWVDLSLSGNFLPEQGSPEWERKYSEYDDVYDNEFSRQLNLAAYDELQSYGESNFGDVTLYPQEQDLPGTALASFALNGSGTVLFEVRGQTQSWGSKQRGRLVTTVERGLTAVVEGVADGSARNLDPERYDDIPATAR